MLPLLLLKRVHDTIRARANSKTSPQYSGSSTRKLGSSRLLGILSVLTMIPTFTLSMLCIFAGNKPGMMEQYAVFTLNTSRIGENMKEELIHEINKVDINFKRSQPLLVAAAVPIVTPAPSTTLITMLPRFDIGSPVKSLTHAADSEIHHVSSKLRSEATSIKSAGASEASGALDSIKAKIIEAIDDAFNGIISGLQLKDFHSVHLMTTCSGEYIATDAKNVSSQGSSLAPPREDAKKRVDSCEKHSAIDPMSLIRIIYWIGAVCAGVALLLAILCNFTTSRKLAFVNIAVTLLGFIFIGLASAVTHGVAVGAAKLINFVGGAFGVAGYVGHNFIAMTWATTILLFVNAVVWSVLLFRSGRATRNGTSNHPRSGRDDVDLAQIAAPKATFSGGRY